MSGLESDKGPAAEQEPTPASGGLLASKGSTEQAPTTEADGLLASKSSAGTPEWVKVTLMGDSTKDLTYAAGKTVGDYLKEAGVNVGDGSNITVNGENVKQTSSVEPNSTIVVASKVKNG